MPISKLDTFREDIRQYLQSEADIRAKIGFEYTMHRVPEIATIWPKVVENNEKFFRCEVSPNDLRTVISDKEMLALAVMLRHTFEQTAAMSLERNPLPQGVKIESVEAAGVPAEWQIVPGASGDKSLLYIHGGGWNIGSLSTHRRLTVALGEATEMRVLSINYRLAPENPFPAGLEDCVRAYQWLLSQGFKPSNIVIAGDSAGGNLALASILDLRDKEISLPKGVVCLAPAATLEFDASALSRGETDPILADMGIFWWISSYLGKENSAELKNPLVSPLLGDLRGFPPLLVQATPQELLFEGARKFVEKMKAAGGNATLQTWDGMVHVWQLFFLGVFPEAQEAIDKVGEWVKRLYAPDQA